MEKQRVFSGIQPSGNLHIGNYIGAVSQWVKNQDQYENIFCIVDSHAITVPQDPTVLKQKIREVALWYLASGIDPQKSTVFVQSQNKNHAQLAWILNCITGMGQLSRMTQYKDKKDRTEFISMGLLDYPVLMAADILLYDANLVPVGEDQKQHVELTRDLAEKFNTKYGPTFTLPRYMPPLSGERIMSLQHPEKKMSKSATDDILGSIFLKDTPDEINNKVKRAVTDSGNEIEIGPSKPAITNLVTIFAAMRNQTTEQICSAYSGKEYRVFKEDLAEAIITHLSPIQKRFHELQEHSELEQVLKNGLDHTLEISSPKLQIVEQKLGLGL